MRLSLLLIMLVSMFATFQKAEARRIDPTTGFYLYQHRHYIPQVGRFGSRDPIEEQGGTTNVYEYTKSDPVNNWDRLGLAFEQMPTLVVRSLLATNSQGQAPSRGHLGADCFCDNNKKTWHPQLKIFWVQAYIIYRTHMYANNKYYELAQSSIESVIAHEQKHVDNFKEWHDTNLPKIEDDFSATKHTFKTKKECSSYLDKKLNKYSNSYYDRYLEEMRHANGPYATSVLEFVGDQPNTRLWQKAPDGQVSPFSNRLKTTNYAK